jgi:hypothetical protein
VAVTESAARVWSRWDAGWWASGVTSGERVREVATALRLALGREISSDELALATVLERIYESEIDVEVTFDPTASPSQAWTWQIGGTRSEPVPLRVLLDWLPSAIARSHPRSDRARWSF